MFNYFLSIIPKFLATTSNYLPLFYLFNITYTYKTNGLAYVRFEFANQDSNKFGF